MYAQRENNAAIRSPQPDSYRRCARNILAAAISVCRVISQPNVNDIQAAQRQSQSQCRNRSIVLAVNRHEYAINRNIPPSAEHTLQWKARDTHTHTIRTLDERTEMRLCLFLSRAQQRRKVAFVSALTCAHKHTSCVVSAFIRPANSIATAIDVKH